MSHALQYLVFDRSEPAEHVVSYDASASVTLARWPQLAQEVSQVLAWAWAQAPEGPGALEDGHRWDLDVQGSADRSFPARLHFDAQSTDLAFEVGEQGLERRTVHLSLNLEESLAQAFEQAGFFTSADD